MVFADAPLALPSSLSQRQARRSEQECDFSHGGHHVDTIEAKADVAFRRCVSKHLIYQGETGADDGIRTRDSNLGEVANCSSTHGLAVPRRASRPPLPAQTRISRMAATSRDRPCQFWYTDQQ